MKIKTYLDINRDKLIDAIYIDTRLDYKKINEVLSSIERYLYEKDILDYD